MAGNVKIRFGIRVRVNIQLVWTQLCTADVPFLVFLELGFNGVQVHHTNDCTVQTL